MKNTKKIALTGSMGTGKSSVIKELQALGIAVLNCDEINRSLMQKGAKGYEQVVAVFSSDVLNDNKELDTVKLSHLIFNDAAEKQRLEAIMHPMIREHIMQYCASCSDAIVVVEVPLLFEVHWESYFDETWVVVCERETLLKRLETYRQVDRQEALRRLSHQMSQREKCAKADVVLHNDADKAFLRKQIEAEVKRILEE